jgi:hypothetical protein
VEQIFNAPTTDLNKPKIEGENTIAYWDKMNKVPSPSEYIPNYEPHKQLASDSKKNKIRALIWLIDKTTGSGDNDGGAFERRKFELELINKGEVQYDDV